MKFKKKIDTYPKIKEVVNIYFGVPGSGKTTFAAWLARRDLRRGGKVWSNVPITGCYKLDVTSDIGSFMIEKGRIIIDEAGIEYNNRNFKNLPLRQIEFFKYHRHYSTAIDVFSQSYEDMDITLRRLAQNYFVVTKSLIPWHITVRKIGRRVGIDENTKQIIDEYRWKPFICTRRIFSPSLWKMFNTKSHKPLPVKKWVKW